MFSVTNLFLISLCSLTTSHITTNRTHTEGERYRHTNKHNTGDVDPIIIVPGIFGSQIDVWLNKTTAPHYFCEKDSGGWTTLWLCFECMVPKVIDCWVDNMLLNFTHNTFQNRDGVRSRTNDFGGTGGIDCLDKNGYYPYFKKLVDTFAALPGYQRGVNLRAAPYDFRYGANSPTGQLYLTDLRKLIEETYAINGNRKVNILAHSMGNLYMLEFFKSANKWWKNKYIKRYLSVSGVFGGSVKSLRALTSGEIESIPRVFVNANVVRKFQRSFQSIYWLLPRAQLWGKDEPLIFTDKRNYTIHQLDDLFEDTKFPLGKDIFKTTEDMIDFVDPGVDVYCIHGSDIPTAAGFRWKAGYFPDYQPEEITGPGDGTVNTRSLELCKKFKKLKDHKVYPGAAYGDHMQILLNPDMIQYLIDIIVNNSNEVIDI